MMSEDRKYKDGEIVFALLYGVTQFSIVAYWDMMINSEVMARFYSLEYIKYGDGEAIIDVEDCDVRKIPDIDTLINL